MVFVNHDSHLFLQKALASLKEAEKIEIIVVDNASPDLDALQEICLRAGAVLLRARTNLGYGRAANAGLRLARGSCLAVANPDLVFSPGALTALAEFLQTHPQAGVVSPQLVYPDGTPQPSARRFPRLRYAFAGRRSFFTRWFPRYRLARDFLYAGLDQSDKPVTVEAVIGALMVFRREALEQVGGFDENYFLFGEDMDLCRRLWQAGWQVYLDPRVRVVHYYGGVRRTRWNFSEYHRVKGLWRFFCQGQSFWPRLALSFAFFGYLCLLQAGGAIGLREFEYSWQRKKSFRTGR